MKIELQFTKPAWAELSSSAELASPVITLSLVSRIGLDGKSAYEVALANGFEGSEQEWLESLTKLSPEADTIAHRAEAAAKEAEAKAGNALTASQSASSSAQQALAAAQNAEKKSIGAETAAQSALTIAERAEGAAGQAAQKAETALTSAQSAVKDSAAASTAALKAQQSATTATTAAQEAQQKTSAAAASADSALASAREASQSAQSALAAASAAADAATESQEQSTAAVEAANQAFEATTGLGTEIERVYTTLHEEILNIDSGGGGATTPKNTGVATYGGFYVGVSPLSLTGNMGFEIFFTTGQDVMATQYVFTFGSAESLVISNGKINFTFTSSISAELCSHARPNTSYHFVLTFTAASKVVETFLNGAAIDKRTATTWSTTITGIRLGKENSFRGVIHHCRFFSDLPGDETIEALWNFGRPNHYALPDSLRTENGGVCKAEFLPGGITDGFWTDTSKNGYQLRATGTVAVSQAEPQPLGVVELSTGPVTGSGSVEATLEVPAGYRIDQLAFTSFNESAMTNVKVTDTGDSSTIAEKASLAAGASLLINLSAAGYIFRHGTTTLKLTAGGNTANGCRLDAKAVWFRLR